MPTKLTEREVANLAPPTDPKRPQRYVWDSETPGFGVIVSRTGVRSYFASGRVGPGGKKIRVAIGRARPGPWSVDAARRRARELLGEMASGRDPHDKRRAASDRLTLREAMELHLDEMRDKDRREVSIDTLRYDVTRLLERHLDQPLDELTVEVVQRIKEHGREHKTQTNRLLAHISAIWTTARRLRRSTFTAESPVGKLGVQKYALAGADEPTRARIADADMPEWLRRVDSLVNPVRRDLQRAALFTGLRDASLTSLQWSMVDLDRGALAFPRSKTTPFAIPVGPTVLGILRARLAENPVAFGAEVPWVFPALRPDGAVGPVAETKERRADVVPWTADGPRGEPSEERALYLPGLHALRRTFVSVAHEIGVAKLDQAVLLNHSTGSRDVHDGYVRQAFEHLRAEVGRIDAALWARLGGPKPRRPGVIAVTTDDDRGAGAPKDPA